MELKKEQPVSEPILTQTGWKELGAIQLGESIFGQDGNCYSVIDIQDLGEKDIYEITFRDGAKTRCGSNHCWVVKTPKQRAKERKDGIRRETILSVETMLSNGFVRTYQNGSIYKYCIKNNAPIQYSNDLDLKISPYLMGLLLGDGGFTGNTITFTNSESDIYADLIEELKAFRIKPSIRYFENHYQANLKRENLSEQRNELKTALMGYNLLGCGSREKFIPDDYFYTSVDDRALLLSGIINTDGSIHKQHILLDSYSHDLIVGAMQLARSLGYMCHFHMYDRTDENSTKKYEREISYKISIIGDDFSLLRLSNKHTNKLLNNKKRIISHIKSIIDIQKIGVEDCRCIITNSPDQSYVTNDYIAA